jgi:hypothetical protein
MAHISVLIASSHLKHGGQNTSLATPPHAQPQGSIWTRSVGAHSRRRQMHLVAAVSALALTLLAVAHVPEGGLAGEGAAWRERRPARHGRAARPAAAHLTKSGASGSPQKRQDRFWRLSANAAHVMPRRATRRTSAALRSRGAGWLAAPVWKGHRLHSAQNTVLQWSHVTLDVAPAAAADS